MTKEKETEKPFWLPAATVGTAYAGLRQAAAEGLLPIDDYQQTITGCQICGDPVACHAAVAGDMDAACRNGQLVRELIATAAAPDSKAD